MEGSFVLFQRCRNDFLNISNEIQTKSVSEVKEYCTKFWKDYRLYPGMSMLFTSELERAAVLIEKTDVRRKRNAEIQGHLELFTNHCRHYNEFPFPKSKHFTPEEDFFLV